MGWPASIFGLSWAALRGLGLEGKKERLNQFLINERE